MVSLEGMFVASYSTTFLLASVMTAMLSGSWAPRAVFGLLVVYSQTFDRSSVGNGVTHTGNGCRKGKAEEDGNGGDDELHFD